MNFNARMRGYTFPGDRTTALLEKPTPRPGPGQVLIRSRMSSICGTDLHLYRESATTRSAFAQNYPGHESVGDVVAVGGGVVWPAVGDRVVGYPVVGCNECMHCLTGDVKRCHHALDPENVVGLGFDGSNAEYVLMPARLVLPLQDDFSYENGSILACNFGTAWCAVRNAIVRPGVTLAVWGLGPVGLTVVLIARAMGIKVFGVDVSEGRRAAGEKLGAHVLDGADELLLGRLAELTSGEGPHAVIDTSGAAAAQAVLVPAVRRKGTIVMVGGGNGSTLGPMTTMILKQLTVKGTWVYDMADWPHMLEFVRQYQVDLDAVVERVDSIDNFDAACRDAVEATGGKILLRW